MKRTKKANPRKRLTFNGYAIFSGDLVCLSIRRDDDLKRVIRLQRGACSDVRITIVKRRKP